MCMISGLLSGNPIALHVHGADAFDRFFPRGKRILQIRRADAGGVREQLADGDGVFAVGGEFRNEFGDGVIETQQAALHQHGDRDGGNRLAGGEPEHQGVGGHGNIEAGVAYGQIGEWLAILDDGKLRADVEAGGDASFNGVAGERELHGARRFRRRWSCRGCRGRGRREGGRPRRGRRGRRRSGRAWCGR